MAKPDCIDFRVDKTFMAEATEKCSGENRCTVFLALHFQD